MRILILYCAEFHIYLIDFWEKFSPAEGLCASQLALQGSFGPRFELLTHPAIVMNLEKRKKKRKNSIWLKNPNLGLVTCFPWWDLSIALSPLIFMDLGGGFHVARHMNIMLSTGGWKFSHSSSQALNYYFKYRSIHLSPLIKDNILDPFACMKLNS